MDGEVVAEALGERAQGVGGERDLVLADRVHAEAVEVVDGGAEPDGLGDRRRAGLELPRELVGRASRQATSRIISPPPRNGGHGVEQLLAAPEHADAGRAAHLVAGEAEEVGARAGHVGGEVGHVLAASTTSEGAGGVGGVGEAAHRGERAEHVRHGGERHELGAVEQAVEVGEVEVAVVAERDPAQLDAALLARA